MNSRGRKSRRAGGLQSHLRDGKNHRREDKGRAEPQGVPAAAASPPPRHSSFPAQTGARWERLGTAVSAAVSACRAEPPHAVMREQDLTQGEVTLTQEPRSAHTALCRRSPPRRQGRARGSR